MNLKLLKLLLIIQVQEHKDKLNVVYKKTRLNPYNPLTYISIILTIVIGFLMFGFVGFWRELDTRNSFKWK